MKNIVKNLSVYGLGHGLIDAVCAGVLFSILKFDLTNFPFFGLVVLYGILAFALQVPFGVLADKFKAPKQFALGGIVFNFFAVFLLFYSPLTAVVLAGIGNALFHVGGGVISLNLTPKRATAPGIFVAPGAIGLFIGTLIGNLGLFKQEIFYFLLVLFFVLITITKLPNLNYKHEKVRVKYFELIFLLLFFAIATRGFVGFLLIFPWKTNIYLIIFLVFGVFLGKFIGGILGDKFGWIRISMISLIISAVLLTIFPNVWYLAIAGMFLFNIVMPITLVAVSNLFPGRPGFAFGVNCLALILGVFPIYFGIKLTSLWLIGAIILISTAAIYFGLRFSPLNNHRKQRKVYKAN
ncbi:MAG: hypothetical protein KKE50_03330 [Nanoarchaeota archaeon]|nr:hypothetical protein [Nanoarchaeota archaeon]